MEMLLETPYFIPNSNMGTLVHFLNEKNVKLSVLTNSLSSTDAFYTVAAFDQRIKPLLRSGINVSIYDGSSSSNVYTAEVKSQQARWGTHAKRAVIGNTTMIGTFNIDPRSNNLNAEMALICRNDKAAAIYIRNSINFRQNHGVALNINGVPADGRPLKFGTSFSKKVLYWLSYPITAFFAPLF